MKERELLRDKASAAVPTPCALTAVKVTSIKALLLPVFEKYSDRIVFAYLFGSAALEEVTPLSDLDFAVFLSHGTRKFYSDSRFSLYADLCRTLKRNDIDLVVLNTAGNIILLEEIVRKGVVFYDKDVEVREAFEIKVIHQAIDFKEQRLAVMGI